MKGGLSATTRLLTLNESPSEKEGKLSETFRIILAAPSLNESPSEKEGKFCTLCVACC